MERIIGSIYIRYTVTCPYCGKYHDSYYDGDWFLKNDCLGEGERTVTNVLCKECNNEFVIEGFEQQIILYG